jgi:glycosyltransferase involved in cell wall biosynthesis
MTRETVILLVFFGNIIFMILVLFLGIFERRARKFILKIPENLNISIKRKKKIVIDIGAVLYKPYGVGIYIKSLLEGIYKSNNNEYEYVLFSNSWKNKPPQWAIEIAKTSDRFGIYHIKFPVKASNFLLKYLKLPKFDDIINNIDILFSPHSLPLPTKNAKRIITIHDLNYLDHPEFKIDDLYEKITIKKAKLADQIITSSKFSKERIINLLKIDDEKINVIYGAPDSEFKPIPDRSKINEVLRNYGINPPSYILYVGAPVKRKNLITLFKAFSIIRSGETSKYKLVLLGVTPEEAFKLRKENNIENIDDGIIALGYLDRNDVAIIYNAAKLMVFPSLYEGFGIPILEAMACGVPVITTKLASIPEIAGDAAFYVENPLDHKELADSITKLLSNIELWNFYKEKGLDRGKCFSWEESARELIEVFEKSL